MLRRPGHVSSIEERNGKINKKTRTRTVLESSVEEERSLKDETMQEEGGKRISDTDAAEDTVFLGRTVSQSANSQAGAVEGAARKGYDKQFHFL